MIKINNLSKFYGKKTGIQNFSFEFKTGNIYGLVGPNGAGKTTLIKLITQFLKIDTGEIIRNFDNNTMLNNISYFPDFDVFIQGSVKKNIEFYNLTYDDTNMKLLRELIMDFDINERDKISSLSAGQRKALRFALTISRKTSVYIMDEPFANIDIDLRSKFISLIFEYIDIENSVVIISSHELHDMDSLLDEVLLIKKSKLLNTANVEDIKANSKQSLTDWYLNQIRV